jgi:GT2 family glycosyltransferase
VFVNDTNIGYGRGHNRNLSQSRGSYVLLLNPDLEFEAGLFNRLSDYLDRHADCAMAGPCILEGSELRPFPPRYFYPGEGMVALQGGLRRRDIAWISGCCVIIRRHMFESLNGFDPDYFLYQEDTDLCLRVQGRGPGLDTQRRQRFGISIDRANANCPNMTAPAACFGAARSSWRSTTLKASQT